MRLYNTYYVAHCHLHQVGNGHHTIVFLQYCEMFCIFISTIPGNALEIHRDIIVLSIMHIARDLDLCKLCISHHQSLVVV